ncbi:MAG: phenylalanine--tRNA ligase subunit beta [Pirellulales bacterium]|nr:phenylalanine--tRNA ligase subunit beta [Pirellulales bacterium]
MIISKNWLSDYVSLPMPQDELEHRLMMSGLNHEGTETVGDDLAIDLEVTSNRPDCLGHLGVAREVSALWDEALTFPAADPMQGSTPASDLAKVSIDCEDLCPRYTARVIRGVKVGPSPDWLIDRLRAVQPPGKRAEWKPVNNIVDITNYVMLECGQPLHAFDMAKLKGSEIRVRRAAKGEKFEAIDHNTYELDQNDCVIADAERAVAIAGVMGGADTEISDATVDVLIESAAFAPVTVRTTARKLKLHSESSFRFERSPDPEAVDWASRRACELILELAGGQLAEGLLDAGTKPKPHDQVTLRFAQIPRILGIDVPIERSCGILRELGCEEVARDDDSITVVPPSWRTELTRECDLIEEVARIYGYDEIPEDVAVPMTVSAARPVDRVLGRVRHVLMASGFDEAMTVSAVDEKTSELFSPWTDAEPLACLTPILRGADRLRRTLSTSLLAARRTNESLANPVAELFEVAHVYLPEADDLPDERLMLGLASGRDFFEVKGILTGLLASLGCDATFGADELRADFVSNRAAWLTFDGMRVGYVAEVSESGRDAAGLNRPATIAEIEVAVVISAANLVPQQQLLSSFPAIARDLNFVVDKQVRWADLAATVRAHGGDHLENIAYQETYRDEKHVGPGKKSLLLSITLRSATDTLTGEEADAVRDTIVAACEKDHGAALRA